MSPSNYSQIAYPSNFIDLPFVVDNALSFYLPNGRAIIKEAIEKSMSNGEPWDFELPSITAKGNEIWITTTGKAKVERLTSYTAFFKTLVTKTIRRKPTRNI